MGASGLNVAHAPCRRYGGLAYRGGRYGELPLPPRGAPIVHERYGDLAPPCERLCMGTPVNKIKYNCKNISNIY